MIKKILLITIGLSVSVWADFSKAGDIVTDSTTALQWQDNAISTTMTWESAITHCENLSLDGHSDWRLPNLKELTSLVDDTKTNPAISTAFEHTASSFYWSSTTYAGYASRAWYVYFGYGNQYYYRKSDSNYVRCVRAGQ